MNEKSVTILLVEDNPAHAELIIRSLEDQKIDCHTHLATDGGDARDYLFHQGIYVDKVLYPRPDLILLDLRLPRMSGLELLQIIKETDELKNIPVVVLTTSSADSDIDKAYELRANSYLVKPGDFNTLQDLVRQMTSYRLNWNYSPQHPQPQGAL